MQESYTLSARKSSEGKRLAIRPRILLRIRRPARVQRLIGDGVGFFEGFGFVALLAVDAEQLIELLLPIDGQLALFTSLGESAEESARGSLCQELIQRGLRDAVLRADFLALQITGFDAGDDVRLRNSERLRDLGRRQHVSGRCRRPRERRWRGGGGIHVERALRHHLLRHAETHRNFRG